MIAGKESLKKTAFIVFFPDNAMLFLLLFSEFFTFQSNEASYEQSAYSNGINYNKFRGGLFIRSYDLTGCQSAGWPGVLSQVRLGSYTLKVELSYPAPRQLRVIFLSVCPSFCLMNTKDVSATLGLIQ